MTETLFANEHDRDTIRRILGPEGLTCRQLLRLSATELYQTTQLPLGLVLQLLEQIKALHEEFPCPPDLLPNHAYGSNPHQTTTTVSEHFQEESSSWLDRYDAEYSHSESRIQRPSDTTTVSHGGYTNKNTNTMDDESVVVPEQRAQSLMKERFGLELPSIRIKPKEENEESIHRISPPEPTRQAQSPPEVTAAAPNAAAAQP
eukprot:scaffold32463_cov221-Amphora_coffeaeformis.AAC.1